MSLAKYNNLCVKAKRRQVHAREMLNTQKSPQENRKLAAADHGSLFDPLHIQNRFRHDELDLIIVEKEYHSGAKYIRQLEPHDGNTIDFTYENSHGHVFYQRYLPEPRIDVYHNKETGKKVTIWKESGKRRVEWLKPEGRAKKGPYHKNNTVKQVTTTNLKTGKKTVKKFKPTKK